jgi:hypothetical protein
MLANVLVSFNKFYLRCQKGLVIVLYNAADKMTKNNLNHLSMSKIVEPTLSARPLLDVGGQQWAILGACCSDLVRFFVR